MNNGIKNNKLIIFNKTGDLTLSWDNSDNDKMLKMIEEKMKQGFTFYAINKNIFGFEKEIPVKDISDIKSKKVILKDKDLEDLYSTTETLTVSSTPDKVIDIQKKLDTPEEVISCGSAAAIPAITGG